MRFEVEPELEDLIDRLENNKMETDKCNNFIDQTEYEDEYSHNEIGEIQEDFIKEAKLYLDKNYKGQYVIFSDWCVHIVTEAYYKKNLERTKHFHYFF